MNDRQLRWLAVCTLVASSGLNYLDRNVFSALMPTLRSEFNITSEQLGLIITAFSIPYALASPVMGFLIDRIGLRWGATSVVGLWSLVGMATGFAGGLGSLVAYRALLGLTESGGIPATGKGYATYLNERDRAFGNGIGQIGITVGTMAAPLLTEFVSPRWGWRSAFVISGVLGFVWIPFWLLVSSRAPAERVPAAAPQASFDILRDGRYIALIAANLLAMTIYSLWFSWTTLFMVTRYGLTQKDANVAFAWIPPLFATVGGLLGGFIASRLIRSGGDVIPVRIRIALGASVLVLATAAAPVVDRPELAIALICLSLAAVTCLSVNYYSIPLDLFGARRAALAISFLTGAFGLMNAFLSPWIGRYSERHGWTPVCLALAPLPLLSALLLKAAFRK